MTISITRCNWTNRDASRRRSSARECAAHDNFTDKVAGDVVSQNKPGHACAMQHHRSAALPQDNDAYKRGAHSSAYDPVALHQGTLLHGTLLLGTRFCRQHRACHGRQLRGGILWVHLRQQQLQQLRGRAILACRLQRTASLPTHSIATTRSKCKRLRTSNSASSLRSKQSAALQPESGFIKSGRMLATIWVTIPSAPRRCTVRLPP